MGFTGLRRFKTLTILPFPRSSAKPHAAVEGSASPDDLALAFSRVRQEAGGAVPMIFRVVLEGRPRLLDAAIRDQVYQIGRAALLNAFLHSDATEVELDLEYAHNLRLAVRDNGKGIDPDRFRKNGSGYAGLFWMRHLAERMGAKFKLLSRVEAGTEVELSIPGDIAFTLQSAIPQSELAPVCELSA